MKPPLTGPKIEPLEPSSHSCYYYEESDCILTIYSKSKKMLTKAEINAVIDMAKARLLDELRGLI